jgi:hypothetical protein
MPWLGAVLGREGPLVDREHRMLKPRPAPFGALMSAAVISSVRRLEGARFRPVKLDGRYEDGEKRHTVVGVGTIEVRSRVHAVGIITDTDGKVKPQPLRRVSHTRSCPRVRRWRRH